MGDWFEAIFKKCCQRDHLQSSLSFKHKPVNRLRKMIVVPVNNPNYAYSLNDKNNQKSCLLA